MKLIQQINTIELSRVEVLEIALGLEDNKEILKDTTAYKLIDEILKDLKDSNIIKVDSIVLSHMVASVRNRNRELATKLESI